MCCMVTGNLVCIAWLQAIWYVLHGYRQFGMCCMVTGNLVCVAWLQCVAWLHVISMVAGNLVHLICIGYCM